jgi:hypothetical protein
LIVYYSFCRFYTFSSMQRYKGVRSEGIEIY